MTRLSKLLPVLAGAAIALAGCKGGSKNQVVVDPPPPPPPPVLDRDFDGVPNTDDKFPDDATRFADYGTVLLDRLTGGVFATAVGVNAGAKVVGYSDDGAGAVKAVAWTVSGGAASAPATLAPIAGNDYSAAYGVGEDGWVAGESEKGADVVAVLWPPAGTAPVELRLDGVGAPAAAYAVQGGLVAGEAAVGGQPEAVLWPSATSAPVRLGTLGGATSSAYAMSATLVVGESRDLDGAVRGVAWRLDAAGAPSEPIALLPLPGHVSSIALGVNAAGHVVGESESAQGEVHAVVWTFGASGTPGAAVDLGPGSAGAVNASARVAGHGAAPAKATVWDSRNIALHEPLVAGEFVTTRAFGLNDAGVAVGLADDRGFVSLPQ